MGRATVLEQVSTSLGFDVDERELSPDIRRHIGELGEREDFLTSDLLEIARLAKKRDQTRGYTIVGGVIGVVLLVFLVGLVFFAVTYWLYRKYQKLKLTVASMNERHKKDSAEFERKVAELSNTIYTELKMIHQQKMAPTVRQFVIDFAAIMAAARGKGILLEEIACPHCGASVRLPDKGTKFQCKYCGTEVTAMSIFDKIGELVGK